MYGGQGAWRRQACNRVSIMHGEGDTRRYYEDGVTKSQCPMLDGVITASIEGRKPGVEGVGDDGNCACGGIRPVLAVIGVSSPGVLLPWLGTASDARVGAGRGDESGRAALSARRASCDTTNDGIGLGGTPCRMLDCSVPGDAGAE